MDKPLKSVTHGQCDGRPTVTSPVAAHRCPATGAKLYCLVTEAHVCEQLAQGRYLTPARPGVELATSRVESQRLNHYTTRPHVFTYCKPFKWDFSYKCAAVVISSDIVRRAVPLRYLTLFSTDSDKVGLPTLG